MPVHCRRLRQSQRPSGWKHSVEAAEVAAEVCCRPLYRSPIATSLIPAGSHLKNTLGCSPALYPRFILYFVATNPFYGRNRTPLAISCTPVGVDLNSSPRTETFCPLCTGPVELGNPVNVVGLPVTTVMLPG